MIGCYYFFQPQTFTPNHKLQRERPEMSTCPVCQDKPCSPNPKGGCFETCGKTCFGKLNSQIFTTTKKICPICNLKPCAPNPNGGYFKTCSKTCHGSSPTPKIQTKVPQCPTCNLKPCAKNPNGGYFKTCSKTCHSNSPISKIQSKIPQCQYCQKRDCFQQKDGTYFAFCSKTCGSNSPIKSKNSLLGAHVNPITDGGKKFQDLEKQFNDKWLKLPLPQSIVSISEIVVPVKMKKSYESYRDKIDQKMKSNNIKPFKKFAGPGNEMRRFHGTTQMCKLGFPNGNTSICKNGKNGCNVCGIIENGFLLSKAKQNTGFGRFGNGIYLSATSGKSNDYNNGTLQYQKPYKT